MNPLWSEADHTVHEALGPSDWATAVCFPAAAERPTPAECTMLLLASEVGARPAPLLHR